jgi:hypothetical protein
VGGRSVVVYSILDSCDLFIFIIKLSMSFQGIRKIRESKRGTPVLLENHETNLTPPLKSFQFPI